MPPAVDRIRQAAKRNRKERLTALLHHITPEALETAFLALRRDAAIGVDGISWSEYEEGLEGYLPDLHRRVHAGTYRALPVRRVTIPKPDGGTRPLGIAALEDKIVQRAMVDVILTPIYEVEFLGFSYGFRPGRKAHDALDALAYGIEWRRVNWICDADLKSYFDTIDRDVLIRFLEHRIGDNRVIKMIRRWLNAGIMEEGIWSDTGIGSVQGDIVSPVLANVYLHYVLDLWFHKKWRPKIPKGKTTIVRYADDVVVGFQYKWDAMQYLKDVRERLSGFGLELHPEKTRIVEFGRFAERDRKNRGERRPETFEFLGFEHFCTKTRKGKFRLGRKPARKKMAGKLKEIREMLRKRMHWDIWEVGKWLGKVLNGWLNYYAVPGTTRWLKKFKHRLMRSWMMAIRRRSQRGRRFSWQRLYRMVGLLWPKTNIRHPWPTQRFAVKHPR